MEKKILHTFRVLNSLFNEARFVYMTAPRGAEDEAKTDADEKDKGGKPDGKEKKEVGKKTVKGKAEVKKEGVKVRSEKRREQLKKEAKLPKRGPEVDTEKERADEEKKTQEKVTPKLKLEEFLKKDSAEQTNALDWLRINRTRQNIKLNAQVWDHSTPEGLAKIKKDFVDLGIMNDPKDAAYYGTMFAVLNGAADKSNPYRAENDGEYIVAFKDSLSDKSRADISGLQAKGNFLGGEAYLKAFDSLTQVRARLMVQDTNQRDTFGAEAKQGVDPIGTTVTDFVKSNVTVLQDAVKKGDYATLALYAVGSYALWKTVGAKLFGGGGGHDAHGAHGAGGGFDIKTWAMWGAAIYGADKLLKNAGYDVLKMAGFKDMNSEVKGTPMESMQNILSQSSVANETKDLDYGIVLKMSETRLVDLDRFMKSAKTSGVDKFIHPREFPDLFPDVKNAWPFKSMDINKPGDAKEREYARIGHQLYKLSLAMPVVYEKTLFKDHPKYKGLTYEKMLTDPVRNDARVWELMEAARQYAPESVGSGFLSGRKPQEIEAKMLAGTDKVLENNGFSLDKTTELKPGSGHIAGHLKGFPIVVVAVKEGYRIYLQSDYNDKLGYNATPGTKFKFIPLEGGKRGAEEAVKRVDDRMGELIKKLQEKNKNISGLTYESGEWKATTKFKGAADLGVAEKENASTIVKPDELGQMLILDGETSSEKYVERDVVGRLLGQKEFEALNVFGNVNRLKISDEVEGDHTFKLLIGKSGVPVSIVYTPGAFGVPGVFAFANTADQEKLVKNLAFQDEYLDAMKSDSKFALNQTVDSFKGLIKDACPEKFLKYFYKSLVGQTSGGVLSDVMADKVSGSIPDSFTVMMMETVRNQVMFKLKNNLSSCATLADADAKMKSVIGSANADLKILYDDVSAKNRELKEKGDEWERTDFMLGVVDRIRSSGTESAQYKLERTNMEALAYKMNLKGLMAGSDLNDSSHIAAGKVIDIFTYHTAHLDSKDLLDNIKFPPTPSDPVKYKGHDYDDPALRGHYYLRYFAYVKDRIVNEVPKVTNNSSLTPDNVPSPTDPRLGILSFDAWAKSPDASYHAFDIEDNKKAFGYLDASGANPHETGEHTELDKELISRLNAAKESMLAEFGDALVPSALEDYLTLGATDPKKGDYVQSSSSTVTADEVGVFVICSPDGKKLDSRIWADSDYINRVAGDRRSVQIRLMNQKVQEFLTYALDTVPGRARFFRNSQSITDKIKIFYSKVKYKIFGA